MFVKCLLLVLSSPEDALEATGKEKCSLATRGKIKGSNRGKFTGYKGMELKGDKEKSTLVTS